MTIVNKTVAHISKVTVSSDDDDDGSTISGVRKVNHCARLAGVMFFSFLFLCLICACVLVQRLCLLFDTAQKGSVGATARGFQVRQKTESLEIEHRGGLYYTLCLGNFSSSSSSFWVRSLFVLSPSLSLPLSREDKQSQSVAYGQRAVHSLFGWMEKSLYVQKVWISVSSWV